MIRSSIITDLTAFDNLDLFLEAFPNLFEDSVRSIFDAYIAPGMLSELRYYPGPAKLPFEFATAKSKRYYFYAVRKGIIKTSGGRYVRTGALAAGWKAEITIDDNAIAISASNNAKAARFVTGKRQVPGHQNTGWPRHDATIDFWRDAAREQVNGMLNQLLRRW